jgi:phosphoribosylformylglycinamidine (FGAM) synthase-like enzyme
VSFYNHTVTEKRNIPVFPTPTIGMVGIVPDVSKRMSLDFKEKGDFIYLLGKVRGGHRQQRVPGAPPQDRPLTRALLRPR